MGTVMSIESAATRRGFAAHNYAPDMDTRTSKLFYVTLPLSPGVAPTKALVLMVNRSETSVRLIYSDHQHSVFFRTYIGPEIPADLQPQSLESLESFLGKHEGLCEAAALLGSADHGPLTLARAIDHHLSTGTSMPASMEYSRDISLDCGQYCHRIAEIARNAALRP